MQASSPIPAFSSYYSCRLVPLFLPAGFSFWALEQEFVTWVVKIGIVVVCFFIFCALITAPFPNENPNLLDAEKESLQRNPHRAYVDPFKGTLI